MFELYLYQVIILRSDNAAGPQVGGDTCWSNMAAAFAALSPPLQVLASITTRTSHYESFTMSGAGYTRNDGPAPRLGDGPRGLRDHGAGAAELA